jgi:hypothetical protein
MTTKRSHQMKFDPSPRVAVGREGRSEAEARLGGITHPHPAARFTRVDPPRKGEG